MATDTRDAPPHTRSRRGPDPAAVVPSESLAPPPKLRRRPMLVAASVVAIGVGALLGVFAWSTASGGHDVLAARSTITRGHKFTRDDLIVVRAGLDPALSSVPAEQMESMVGKRAALDVPAGSLLTDTAVQDQLFPGAGLSVVGVAVGPGGLPSTPLAAGDQVRVVLTPGPQGTIGRGDPPTMVATAISVTASDGGAAGAHTVVSVVVPQADAATIASWSATGRVAIVLDSRES